MAERQLTDADRVYLALIEDRERAGQGLAVVGLTVVQLSALVGLTLGGTLRALRELLQDGSVIGIGGVYTLSVK